MENKKQSKYAEFMKAVNYLANWDGSDSWKEESEFFQGVLCFLSRTCSIDAPGMYDKDIPYLSDPELDWKDNSTYGFYYAKVGFKGLIETALRTGRIPLKSLLNKQPVQVAN